MAASGKCGHCTAPGRCGGESFPRLCELAATSADYARLAAEMGAGIVHPPPPQIRDHFDRLARMRACPHFEPSSSCGCGLNICTLGKGDRGRVAHHDCLACLEDVS